MTDVLRVLFQGDSLTDAFRKPEEINPAYQLGNGYAFLVAARLARMQPGRFEFFNRGVSGDTVGRLSDRWQADALDLRPDVLSVLVGVNDTGQAMLGKPSASDEEFAATYRQLLGSLRTINPASRFVLLEPFVLEAGEVTADWRAHLQPKQRIIAEIAGDFGAVFVPVQAEFDRMLAKAPAAYWAYDGVHPTHAGFQLLADAWLEAAGPTLCS